MNNGNVKQNNEVEWESIILSLHSYTLSIINSKKWFRGKKTTSYLKGNEVLDYVNEAITRHLENPEKFDSTRGTLVNYLKFNLIRTLVGNDSRAMENKKSDNSFSMSDEKDGDIENSGNYLDSIFPYVSAYFDDEIDYDNVLNSIEIEIGNDQLLKNLFVGVTQQNMKRREVIELFNLTSKEYDNGVRRLKTILSKVANQYDLSN